MRSPMRCVTRTPLSAYAPVSTYARHSRTTNVPSAFTPVLIVARAECRRTVLNASSTVSASLTGRPASRASAVVSGSIFA